MEEETKCDKCGVSLTVQTAAAMFFNKGDTNDQKYLCTECAPNPFD